MNKTNKLTAWLLGTCLLLPPFSLVADDLDSPVMTAMGAERAGNSDHSIPAFADRVPVFSPEIATKPGVHLPNPYDDEKPLYEITATNVEKYRSRLSDGQLALFRQYPSSFRMLVYPTHRDAVYSDWVNHNVAENAKHARLVEGGNGLINAFGGPPFPMPKNGQEAIWNHLTRASAPFVDVTYDAAAVYNNGEVAMERYRTRNCLWYYNRKFTRETFNGYFGSVMREKLLPLRTMGELVLLHEPVNQAEEPRSAWTYQPATRRVRRAPVVAYDGPLGPGNLITADDGRLFNGAIDRFDWKLVGKRELYIPYHNYDLDSPKLKYKEMLTPHHLNPQYVRFELHRVWVVEATLKPEFHHVYGHRLFYLDEDSWAAQVADNYDNDGQLWRTGYLTQVTHPQVPGFYSRMWVIHDLQSQAYIADQMVNEREKAEDFTQSPPNLSFYSPSNMTMINSR